MITINELRIGNLVLHNGVEWYVDGIHRGYPHSEERFNEKDYVDLSFDGIISATLEEIEPIHITEEILLKFGFNKDSDGDICFGKILYWIEGGFIQIAIGYTPLTNISCEYVHQLQNLIFSLYQTELTF